MWCTEPNHMILLLRCIQQTETLLFTFLRPTAPKRPFLYRYLKTAFVLMRFIIWCFCVRNIQHTDRIANIYSFYYSLFVALNDSVAHCIQQVLVLEKALIEFENYVMGSGCVLLWRCLVDWGYPRACLQKGSYSHTVCRTSEPSQSHSHGRWDFHCPAPEAIIDRHEWMGLVNKRRFYFHLIRVPF